MAAEMFAVLLKFDCLSSVEWLSINIKRILQAEWFPSPRLAILISDCLHCTTFMVPMKHDHTIVILEKLLAIDVASSTGGRRTGRVNCRQKVEVHETTRIVKGVLAERLPQFRAVGVIHIAQRDVRINDLIRLAIQPLVRTVRAVREMHINRLAGVIRQKGMDL